MSQVFIVSGSTERKFYDITFYVNDGEPIDFLSNGANYAAEFLGKFYGRNVYMDRVLGESIIQVMHKTKMNESSAKAINKIDNFIKDFSNSFYPALLSEETENNLREIKFEFVKSDNTALVITILNTIYVVYSGLSARDIITKECSKNETFKNRVFLEILKYMDTQTDIEKTVARYWKADLIDLRNS